MTEDHIEKCLVGACFRLLKDNEGIIVEVDGIRYVVWVDAENKLLKISDYESDTETFEDAAMTIKSRELKDGDKIWVHGQPN